MLQKHRYFSAPVCACVCVCMHACVHECILIIDKKKKVQVKFSKGHGGSGGDLVAVCRALGVGGPVEALCTSRLDPHHFLVGA